MCFFFSPPTTSQRAAGFSDADYVVKHRYFITIPSRNLLQSIQSYALIFFYHLLSYPIAFSSLVLFPSSSFIVAVVTFFIVGVASG